MRLLYNIGIFLYRQSIQIASFFSPKAKLWLKGRKHQFQRLEQQFAAQTEGCVWFHCASLGEFEQARPLIEAYRAKQPDAFLLLTFFSPSGYEIRKHYDQVDWVAYLPSDLPGNVRRFIKIVQPQKAFFIKYEFWFNYLKALHDRNIPTYLVSGIFRPSQHFFKFYGGWFRKQLQHFDYFFLQNETSASLLKSIGFQNFQISGDSRFDRVVEIAKENKGLAVLAAFTDRQPTIVAGSTWEKDEKILVKLSQTHDWKMIIAPHQIEENAINHLQKSLGEKQCIRWTNLTEDATDIHSYQFLIMDTIGLLSKAYYHGDVAYVGGGFGSGIHNTLEAAVYGIPVIFGPNYQKFEEAKALIACGGGFSIQNGSELLQQFQQLNDAPNFRLQSGNSAKDYVYDAAGATKIILSHIQ